MRVKANGEAEREGIASPAGAGSQWKRTPLSWGERGAGCQAAPGALPADVWRESAFRDWDAQLVRGGCRQRPGRHAGARSIHTDPFIRL